MKIVSIVWNDSVSDSVIKDYFLFVWYCPVSVSEALEFYCLSTRQTAILDDGVRDRIIRNYGIRDTVISDDEDRGNLRKRCWFISFRRSRFSEKASLHLVAVKISNTSVIQGTK
jgi:hypothetical protein